MPGIKDSSLYCSLPLSKSSAEHSSRAAEISHVLDSMGDTVMPMWLGRQLGSVITHFEASSDKTGAKVLPSFGVVSVGMAFCRTRVAVAGAKTGDEAL